MTLVKIYVKIPKILLALARPRKLLGRSYKGLDGKYKLCNTYLQSMCYINKGKHYQLWLMIIKGKQIMNR